MTHRERREYSRETRASAVALHLDACIPNFLIQELDPFRVPEHFALADGPIEPQVKNGKFKIPNRPGYGVDLVRDKIAPCLAAQVG